MPFTAEQFFDVFRQYNQGVWPAQVVFVLGASLMLVLAYRRWIGSQTMALTLAALWIWMAIGYHVIFFSLINPAAYVFAALFLVQAALLLWYGFRWKRLRPDRHPMPAQRAAAIVLAGYALAGYPLLGLLAGQRYPELPTFGLPCPTTIYTLGMLLLVDRPAPSALFVIPAMWSVIATVAAISFGVTEDFALVPLLLIAIALNGKRVNARSSNSRLHAGRPLAQ